MRADFDLAGMEPALQHTAFAGQIHHLHSTASTNTLAVEAAQAGVATGVWLADEQTAGRGRAGHTWHSAAGDGLYVSVLMRPHLRGADALKISLATGIAVVDAVEHATGAELRIRWPNDLLDAHAGRKLGGILTETAMEADGTLSYAVIGIGLNLNQAAMPEPLQAIATSLRMSYGLEHTPRERLLPLLLMELTEEVDRLVEEVNGRVSPDHSLLRRFELYSPMTRNLAVHVEEDGGYTGMTDGLEPGGLLRIRMTDGSLRIVRHGGVRALTHLYQP